MITQMELIRLYDLNVDLLDANHALVSYLVDVYEKNGITHDEFSRTKMLHKQASKALARLNNERYQPKFDSQKNNHRFYRTAKQVLLPLGLFLVVLPCG